MLTIEFQELAPASIKGEMEENVNNEKKFHIYL